MLTRTLKVATGTSETTVTIVLHAPSQGDGFWECRYDIGWPEGIRSSRARGYDNVQALYLAMQRVAVELYGSTYHAEGKLCWDKPGDGYGFPMPKVGYEDLIGEDRTAQVPD